jgi:hypothetical protein
MQVHDPPPPLPEQVPAALRELVGQLLVKDREARVPDAATALAGLRAALAGPAPSAPALAPAPPPPAHAGASPGSPLARFDKRWLYAIGGLTALLLIVALWPSGGEGEGGGEGEELTAASVLGSDERPKPDEATYREIDRLLSAKDAAGALSRIRAARDGFPDDGGLLWREGRALVIEGGVSNRTTALLRYADAFKAAPELGKETAFAAEVLTLLRDKRLRERAIDVAVRDLGHLGDEFLFEVVQDEDAELGYVDRHRILDRLPPAMIVQVDYDRQHALDLGQAGESPTPCTTFGDALDAISDSGSASLVGAVFDRSLEVPSAPGEGEAALACSGLDAKLEKVKAELESAHPEAASKAKRKKKGKRRSGFRLPF